MQLGIDVDGVFLDQCLAGLIVAFRLDALDLGEKFAEKAAKFLKVVDHKIGLAVAHLLLDHVVGPAVLVAPVGDELAVLHVGFGIGLAQLDAAELRHDAVADVAHISCLVGLRAVEQAEFHQFRIGHVVEAEEVGTGFLERGGEFFQGVGRRAGQQLAGTVSEAFVKVGVQVVGDVAVFLAEVDFGLIPGKFRENALGALLRSERVGVGDVGNGHGFGPVLLADPVGVGQIDADGRGGIVVTGDDGHVDDLGRYAFDFFLLEAGIDRRVVLEPLGVAADEFRPFRSLAVAIVHDAFPGSLAAEGIVVILDEAVDEIHVAVRISHPADVVLVPHTQVARPVVFNEFVDVFLLQVVLGEGACSFQVTDDHLEGRAVDTAHLPDLFHDLAVFLHHFAVEAIADGVRIGRVFHLRIEIVDFFCVDVIIEIHGRCLHQVFLRALILQCGVQVRIEDHILEENHALGFRTYGLHQALQIRFRAAGDDFVVGIVMMDAVAEEHAFGIGQEVLPFLAPAFSFIVLEDVLEDVADFQIVFEILVPGDVAARLGGL